jgi:GxxExxY protein
MSLEHEELTHAIIGAAIAVHTELGPGFVESIYQRALMIEFDYRKLRYDAQLSIRVRYRGDEVGRHQLDLMVEGLIVVELKAIKQLDEVHFSIVRSYLHAADLRHGLLLNFARPKLEIKRVFAHESERSLTS